MKKKIDFLINNSLRQYAHQVGCKKTATNATLALLLFAVLLSLNLAQLSAQTTQTFSTPGTTTWTVPCGVTSVTVQAWGGGGSGASDVVNDNIGVGGGGGGGYSSSVIAVTPGASVTVVVGAGGLAPSVTPFGGVAGGASSFGALTANGGAGGATGGAGGAGGIGTTSNGTNGSNNSGAAGGAGGAGGTPGGGAGGAGGADGGSGLAGVAPGGGGGGAGDAASGGSGGRIGGNGARGEVRITYTCPSTPVALAGPDQTLSGTNLTATLAANAPTCGASCGTACGVGTWTVVSGTATFSNPNSATSAVTVSPCSSATLRWTIDNSPCGSSFDDVVVNASSVLCPVPCEPNSTGTGFPITNVTFAGINNSVANSSLDYENFMTLSPGQVDEGGVYTLSVTASSNGTASFGVVAYFDWNGDGDFTDAGEKTFVGSGTAASFTVTEVVGIPSCATGSLIRMRIITANGGFAPPCYSGTANIQAEDYLVQINNPVSLPYCNATTNSNLSSPSCTLGGINPYGQVNTGTGGGGSCLGTTLPFTFTSDPGTCTAQYGGGGGGTEYGCMSSQPNPSWFTLEVATTGTLCLSQTNSANVDIDYVMWGPIPDCDTATPGWQPPSDCLGTPVRCDYETTTTFQIGQDGTLNNNLSVVAGEHYIILITNFAGTTTNITLAQCGTATFTCPPTPCTSPPASPVVADGTRCGTGTVTFTVTTGCSTGTLTYYNDPGLTSPWSGTGNTTPSISTTTTYYATCQSAADCKSPADAVKATVQTCCADNGTTSTVVCPP